MSKNIGVARLICENTKLKSYYACHKVYHTAKYSEGHAQTPSIFSHCSPTILQVFFGKNIFFPKKTRRNPGDDPKKLRSYPVKISQNQSKPVKTGHGCTSCHFLF